MSSNSGTDLLQLIHPQGQADPSRARAKHLATFILYTKYEALLFRPHLANRARTLLTNYWRTLVTQYNTAFPYEADGV